MARLVSAVDSHLSVSTLAGSPRYVPPEYYQSFRCSTKGDHPRQRLVDVFDPTLLRDDPSLELELLEHRKVACAWLDNRPAWCPTMLNVMAMFKEIRVGSIVGSANVGTPSVDEDTAHYGVMGMSLHKEMEDKYYLPAKPTMERERERTRGRKRGNAAKKESHGMTDERGGQPPQRVHPRRHSKVRAAGVLPELPVLHQGRRLKFWGGATGAAHGAAADGLGGVRGQQQLGGVCAAAAPSPAVGRRVDLTLLRDDPSLEQELLEHLKVACACLDDRPARFPTMLNVMVIFKEIRAGSTVGSAVVGTPSVDDDTAHYGVMGMSLHKEREDK
ncbi:hypothetical protein Taro_015193 [Colocasia esculenta]|uniref:Uncharacterized protein n=1 Tax=Colocasia esculenta TaxID=4460 RepID=A0A843UP48_COLES|nr:hypothetical protein [Colocasia esculenta]